MNSKQFYYLVLTASCLIICEASEDGKTILSEVYSKTVKHSPEEALDLLKQIKLDDGSLSEDQRQQVVELIEAGNLDPTKCDVNNFRSLRNLIQVHSAHELNMLPYIKYNIMGQFKICEKDFNDEVQQAAEFADNDNTIRRVFGELLQDESAGDFYDALVKSIASFIGQTSADNPEFDGALRNGTKFKKIVYDSIGSKLTNLNLAMTDTLDIYDIVFERDTPFETVRDAYMTLDSETFYWIRIATSWRILAPIHDNISEDVRYSLLKEKKWTSVLSKKLSGKLSKRFSGKMSGKQKSINISE